MIKKWPWYYDWKGNFKDSWDTKRFFRSGKTLDVGFRITHLKKLYDVIKQKEDKIVGDLYKDLGKSKSEAYMCEIGLVLNEISYMLKHTGSKKVGSIVYEAASKMMIPVTLELGGKSPCIVDRSAKIELRLKELSLVNY